MAKIEETRNYAGKSANECYAAGVSTFSKCGFNVWKKREIAWLALAKRTENGKEIDSNFSARPGNPTPVTLTVSSDSLTEDVLRPFAQQFFAALDEELKISG